MKEYDKTKLKVINVGLQSFYEAVEKQGVKVTQLEWRPPVKLKPEILALLDKLLLTQKETRQRWI